MTAKVRGFRFSGISANIKNNGRRDLALVVADQPAVAAAVFTRNLVRAAPVLVAERRCGSGRARAILVNSGNANACTGEAGLAATLESTAAVARALRIDPDEVLPASTGVIGSLLPAERIVAATPALVQALDDAGHEAFADAICTTDRWPKLAHAELVGGSSVLGIAKGAGMIHPELGPPQATLLGFLFTDAQVSHAILSRTLQAAVDETFNACSVDGDTSTNDTIVALASGASGRPCDDAALQTAFTRVCEELARSIVADGEGTEHTVELSVSGLADNEGARRIARTVATSLLVKTALQGKDANWGRILAAAGRAGVPFNPERARLSIGGVEIVRHGMAVGSEAEREANQRMREASYRIELQLGAGTGHARYWMADLGHGYVDVNASYRS